MSRIAPFLGLTLIATGLPTYAQTAKPSPERTGVILRKKPSGNDTGTKPPVSKGVFWKFTFEKGRVTKFNEKLTIAGNLADGTGFSIDLKNISVETIKDVTKTGDGTVETRSEAGEATIDGEPFPDAPPIASGATTTVIGVNGRIVKRTPSQTSRNVEVLNKVAPIALSMPTPPESVEPGDEWKTEITNPFLPEQKVVVTSQYEDQGKFGTMIVYRIRINALIAVREDDEENADAIQVNGYYEFEPVKQRVVKSDITIENLDMEIKGQKARVSVEGILAMIGKPDQLNPRPTKTTPASNTGKKKK